MSVLGVDRYKTSSRDCRAKIEYDPRQLCPVQIIEILDAALANAEHPDQLDRLDLHLPICTASLPLAAVAQFAMPALLPLSAALFAYTSIPSFRGAYEVLFKERRLGVDVLDSIVVIGCLATMQVFPGCDPCWCLSVGRFLVQRTQDNSKKLLLNAFGKQPRYVWLVQDGVEIEVSLDRLEQGRHHRRQHRRGGAGRRHHRRGTGDDRPARPDRRVDAGREGRRRPRLRLDRDGRRQDARLGREIGQRDRVGQDQPDPQRHRRLQAHLAAQGRAAGRQGGDPDALSGRARVGHIGPAGRGGGAQQRLRHRHPDGRTAGDAVVIGALRAQGNPGQGRPGARADERGRHGPVRQDRHADARAARGRPGHRRQRLSADPDPSARRRRRAEVPPPDRPGDPAQGRGAGPRACRRPTPPSTRSATASPSASTGTESASAASGSWRWRASR